MVYGNFAGSFTSFSVDSSAREHFQHQTNQFTLYFVYIGIGSFVSVYIGMVGMYTILSCYPCMGVQQADMLFLGFSYTGERITQKIRELYLRAIFRQNIAFFDFLGSGEVTTRISSGMCHRRDISITY